MSVLQKEEALQRRALQASFQIWRGERDLYRTGQEVALLPTAALSIG